jgi:hypothetical protein
MVSADFPAVLGCFAGIGTYPKWIPLARFQPR